MRPRLKKLLFATVDYILKTSLTRQEFSDFYVLNALSPLLEAGDPRVKNFSELLKKRNHIIWTIVNEYSTGLLNAIYSELGDMSMIKFPDNSSAKTELESAGITNDLLAIKAQAKAPLFSKDEIRSSPRKAIAAFESLIWPSGWGGKPWARIVGLYEELLIAKKDLKINENYPHKLIRDYMDGEQNRKIRHLAMLVDRIHQAEHNNGSIFTYINPEMTQWLGNALNEKAINNSFQLLLKQVSPELRDVAKKTEMTQEDINQEELEEQLGEVMISRQLKKYEDKNVNPDSVLSLFLNNLLYERKYKQVIMILRVLFKKQNYNVIRNIIENTEFNNSMNEVTDYLYEQYDVLNKILTPEQLEKFNQALKEN